MTALGSVLIAALLCAQLSRTQELGQAPFPPVRYPSICSGPAAGDLDGDGDMDLAACRGGDVWLLWGSGGGWIERTASLSVPASMAALGDMDGNSLLDVVTLAAGEAHVVLADGQAGYGPPSSAPLGDTGADLMLADLDLDGDLDALAICATSVRVLLGDGHGGLAVGFTASLAGSGQSGALGDLNEDGWLDLVVLPGGEILLGDGQGAFSAGGALAVGGGWYDAPCLGDFNGDGHLDVLAPGQQSGEWLLFGDGLGGFTRHLWLPESGPYFAAGDLDRDGDLDVVRKSSDLGVLGVWLNDGAGSLSFIPKSSATLGPASARASSPSLTWTGTAAWIWSRRARKA